MAILSLPSYVIPGTYLENIRYLESARTVENIELLFFSFDEETERLLADELDAITGFHGRFSYSVHLPEQIDDRMRRLVSLLRPIAERFVVHVPADDIEGFAEKLNSLRHEFGDAFLVENVAGREYRAPFAQLSDYALCCDTGHLLLDGESPLRFFESFGHRVGEIHLHGISQGKDHRPLSGDEHWLHEITPYLRRFNGVIHIEIFHEHDALPMLERINTLLKSEQQETRQ